MVSRNILLAAMAAMLPMAAAAQSAPQPARVTVSEAVNADGIAVQVHETRVAVPPGAVWEMIATAEGWTRWAHPMARFSPEDPDVLESSWDAAAEPGGPRIIRQRFLERVPGERLSFRTEQTPEGFPFGADYTAVTSTFELAPDGDGTRVRLSTTGYPGGETGENMQRYHDIYNDRTLNLLHVLLEGNG